MYTEKIWNRSSHYRIQAAHTRLHRQKGILRVLARALSAQSCSPRVAPGPRCPQALVEGLTCLCALLFVLLLLLPRPPLLSAQSCAWWEAAEVLTLQDGKRGGELVYHTDVWNHRGHGGAAVKVFPTNSGSTFTVTLSGSYFLCQYNYLPMCIKALSNIEKSIIFGTLYTHLNVLHTNVLHLHVCGP